MLQFNETNTSPCCFITQGWKKHGNSCYLVNATQVAFKDQCNMTIRNRSVCYSAPFLLNHVWLLWEKRSHARSLLLCRFEQAFISRLLAEQIGRETQYFWIGLQDVKNTGEYRWQNQNSSAEMVRYTNWGWFEPGK